MHSASLISPISVWGGGGVCVKRTHVYITTPTPLDGYIYKFACGHTVYLDCGRAGNQDLPLSPPPLEKKRGENVSTPPTHCTAVPISGCDTHIEHRSDFRPCFISFQHWRHQSNFLVVLVLFCLFFFLSKKKARDWNVEKLPIITRRNTCCWLHGGMRCSGAHERRRRHFFFLSGWLLLQPVIQLQQLQQQRDK